MKEIEKYDIAYADESYGSRGANMGLHYIVNLCDSIKFKSVLDVGCGPGWCVTEFLKRKYITRGVEPCEYLHKHELRVLAGLDIVKKCKADKLPFNAETFDLVFSTDVLEHIPEEESKKAIREMIRVSKKYIFCTISFIKAVCFPKLKLHCNLHPHDWWAKEFERYRVKKVKIETPLYLTVKARNKNRSSSMVQGEDERVFLYKKI